MLKFEFTSSLARAVFTGTLLAAATLTAAQFAPPASGYAPKVMPASDEGETAIKRFRLPKGFKCELVAAEPLLANPVAFCIDEQGRFYVAETFRLHSGVTDIRGHMEWLDEDLASRSVAERVAMMKKHEGERIANYAKDSDRVRLLVDTNGDGKLDKSTVFSDGYNHVPDGLGSGVLARKGDVYWTCIPDLWRLRDNNGDGVAEVKQSLHTGFGVRVGFLGHDLHGLRFGPDGKLYFSIGDRGAHIKLGGGKTVESHETGCVFRCNPDGSELEIFATGLRNPQELVFDQFGNLWTGDNNSDGGDPARWVYLVEGGDSGWRIGWQFINSPNSRGPWLAERLCYPQWDGQAAYLLPPLANIGNGPSGLTYDPGTGLPERYRDHFFLCDFRGGSGSGIHSFTVRPKGAGFEVFDRTEFVWEMLVTDCDFGYDGALYITDWVEGWNKTGKGRIYRVFDPKEAANPVVAETKKLIAAGFDQRSLAELAGLLTHPDQRVRQEAQFALAAKGSIAIKTFAYLAEKSDVQLARLHALWGLGQISNLKSRVSNTQRAAALEVAQRLLYDADAEVRAQAAKVLGDTRWAPAFGGLLKLMANENSRSRFFAALALAKLGKPEAVPALVELLRANANQDRYLRHAAVMGLASCADAVLLKSLAKDASSGVRMGAVLALRRQASPGVAAFLADADPLIVAEAARAINDLPIAEALPQLAAYIGETEKLRGLPELAADKKNPGVRDAVLRRVINANFRLGDSVHAQALAAFAANETMPDAMRAEAITVLAEWAKPSGRDRVTGLWRPLAVRDAREAVAALQPRLVALLRSPSQPVKLAATKVSTALGIKAGSASAHELLADTRQPATVRAESLKSLAALKDAKLADAITLALADRDESLRREATKIQAQFQPAEALTQLKATLDTGSVGEKQTALAALATLSGTGADEIFSQWLDQLLARQAPPELHLDILEASAKRSAPALKAKIRQFEEGRDGKDEMRSYRESLAGGNAEEGRRIFMEKAEVFCARCHKAGAGTGVEGGEVGPDLTGIGARQTREYLLESIVLPNRQFAKGYESLIVTMKSGTAYAGLPKSETDTVLELNSPEDGLLKLNKADIKSRDRGLSAMPEEFRQVLTKRELRDLVEFLGGLKQP